MLAGHRMGREDAVVEEVRAEQQRRDADPRCRAAHRALATTRTTSGCDHRAGVVDTEYQSVEDDAGPEDDPGLEASAGTEVTVKLHVEREQQDERQEQLRGDLEVDCDAAWCAGLQSRRVRPNPRSARTRRPRR